MSRFLAAYEDLFAKSTDAPVEFGHAGGLAVLSTIALGRRWIERGGEKIHPNLFMLLCADSSKERKSTSVKLAANLLREVIEERVGPDNFTPAGLYRYMEKKVTRLLLPLGEFGVFLAHAAGHSQDLYSEMCNLYDNQDIVKARAKEIVTIKDPIVTLFGGVAYGMLDKYMKQEHWDAGFYPRMLWITPITRRQPYTMVPNTPVTERKIAINNLNQLTNELANSIDSHGPMQLIPGADKDYTAFADSLITDEKLEDATVNAQRERLKNIVFKLAVLYQIDIDPLANIGPQAMDQAYAFAKTAWISFKTVFDKSYGALIDRYNTKVWRYIVDNRVKIDLGKDLKTGAELIDHGVWRKDINHWQHRRLRDLESAIATLTQRGVIEQRSVKADNNKRIHYYTALQEPNK